MKDNIIRYYWLVGDRYNGEDFEENFKSRDEAVAAYNKLTSVPYKKLCECTYTDDITIMEYHDGEWCAE